MSSRRDVLTRIRLAQYDQGMTVSDIKRASGDLQGKSLPELREILRGLLPAQEPNDDVVTRRVRGLASFARALARDTKDLLPGTGAADWSRGFYSGYRFAVKEILVILEIDDEEI